MTYSSPCPVTTEGSPVLPTSAKAMTFMSNKQRLESRSFMAQYKKKTAIRSSGISTLKKQAKKLSFKTIEIIELPITLGDNPSVQDGPPVSCGWGCLPQLRVSLDLDLFEQWRHGQRRHRRRDLIMSKSIREQLLHKQGISKADILQATINAKKIKLERLLSRTLLQKTIGE